VSSKKKGCREPSNETPESMSENNPRYLVSKDPSWHESNANYVTSNLAKKISVRQNHNETVLMFLQGMKQDQNEKLDTILESVKSLEHKFLQNKKDEQAARREKCW